MKAISIHQPYAHLITLPESDPRHKRVENRWTWHYKYTGPVAIHASKTRERVHETIDAAEFRAVGGGGRRIEQQYRIPIEDLTYGAVVAVAELLAVFDPHFRANHPIPAQHAWVLTHSHAEPACTWILLANVRPLATPIPYRGQQGLFTIPDDLFPSSLRRSVASSLH